VPTSLADRPRPTAASLDLHEGIVDPLAGYACRRWPEHLRLVNEHTGEIVRGRCRATNLCDYCARLFCVETSELLMLDAMEDSPSLYVVLTARELLARGDCREHLAQLRRSLRKVWPDVRWAVLVEFQRRGALHLNLLVKGVPVDAAERLHAAVCRVWCTRVDAEPVGQFVGAVNDGAGLVRYIALHFLKPDQSPPKGWRGHRYSATRDYLVRPAKELRVEARRSLQVKRAIWRGMDAATAELEVAYRASEPWSLRSVPPGSIDLSVRRRDAAWPPRRADDPCSVVDSGNLKAGGRAAPLGGAPAAGRSDNLSPSFPHG